MKETDLHFFIDSTVNYFKEITKEKPSVGIPYLKGSKPLVLDFTGIIGISGLRKGSIYITTTSDLLKDLSALILGKAEVLSEEMKDLVGEIANTISGNVREAYGSNFLISVPVIVEGRTKDIKMPADIQTYVIPLSWKNHNFHLVVCLE